MCYFCHVVIVFTTIRDLANFLTVIRGLANFSSVIRDLGVRWGEGGSYNFYILEFLCRRSQTFFRRKNVFCGTCWRNRKDSTAHIRRGLNMHSILGIWSQNIPFSIRLEFVSSDFDETLRKCSWYKHNEAWLVRSHVRPFLPGSSFVPKFRQHLVPKYTVFNTSQICFIRF